MAGPVPGAPGRRGRRCGRRSLRCGRGGHDAGRLLHHRANARLVHEVADTGEGIFPEEQEKIEKQQQELMAEMAQLASKQRDVIREMEADIRLVERRFCAGAGSSR